MIRRFMIWGVTALLIAAGVFVRAAETLRIVPITSDDTVVVSFELSDAYNDAIKQSISSGLRTQFTYDIELRMVGNIRNRVVDAFYELWRMQI